MHTKKPSKKLTLALLAITLLGACRPPKNAATLRKHGNQKIIAGSVLGATGAGAVVTPYIIYAAIAGEASILGLGTIVFLWPLALVTIPVGIALITIGATEHRKAKKLAEQERLAELEILNTPKDWHTQPLELEPVS